MKEIEGERELKEEEDGGWGRNRIENRGCNGRGEKSQASSKWSSVIFLEWHSSPFLVPQ